MKNKDKKQYHAGVHKVDDLAPPLAFSTSLRMLHLLVNTYDSVSTALEDVGTSCKVLVQNRVQTHQTSPCVG